MTALPHIQYFLGANAPGGFRSLYDQLIPYDTARAVYILKGGPGCGKSTLMRRVAAQAEQAGLEVEYILCSGDPDSLDAVVLPGAGTALVDGTAPHVVEPKLPGAVDRYVDLGACYDHGALYPLRREITRCMAGYKGCYARAYRCLGAAADLFEDQRAALLTDGLSHKLARRAQGILNREVPRRKGVQPGRVKQRFLGAVSCQGSFTLYDTAFAQCQRVYELSDSYGLGHEMLLRLLAGLTAAGFDAVACPDPMAPDRLSHLLAPQRGLAFLPCAGGEALPRKAYRRIRLDAAADGELLRRCRSRLRFAKKVSRALTEEAVTSLAQAKAIHDELEAVYHPYVDFGRVEETAGAIAREILSL